VCDHVKKLMAEEKLDAALRDDATLLEPAPGIREGAVTAARCEPHSAKRR
jgi:hypothetical protein